MSVRLIRQALAVFLFLAACGLFFASFFDGGSARTESVPPPPPKFSLVRTARPIVQGSIIRRDDVEVISSTVPPARGTIGSLSDAANRVATRNISRAEPLSDANTAAPQLGNGLSELIPPGLRAVALRVSDETAVANLIRPGDRVDVLLLSNAAKSQVGTSALFPPAEAATILQNVLVLAVGGTTLGGSPASATHNVTLAVTPREAAIVALVRSVGSEYLTLRSAHDSTDSATKPVFTQDLQPERQPEKSPEPRAAAPAQPRLPQRTVEIIAGKSDNVSHVRLDEAK